MNINVDFSIDPISSVVTLVAWLVIFFLAYRLYRKHGKNIKGWKVAFLVFVGIFSFSFNFSFAGEMMKLSILPLGVWILYFLSKNKDGRWQRIRPYAWLGFFANFIFLAGALISMLIGQGLYPKDELATYLASVEELSSMNIHPSAKDIVVSKEILQKQIQSMRKEKVEGMHWYQDEETYQGANFIARDEKFPYLLEGIKPKWGSGLSPVFFLEKDGKGLLVTTADRQLYYRFDESLIEGGN